MPNDGISDTVTIDVIATILSWLTKMKVLSLVVVTTMLIKMSMMIVTAHLKIIMRTS